jgi:hypothetical protein
MVLKLFSFASDFFKESTGQRVYVRQSDSEQELQRQDTHWLVEWRRESDRVRLGIP